MKGAYYNEIDAYAAEWLENLIRAGHIAQGDVDRRSIVEVRPDDLRGYAQCHFFAGIGGWSYALRLAGWSDDRPVWTGSCPCQPFSVAGRQRGSEDERHLWPAWFRIIRERRPSAVFGEQVAGASGLAWLDHVCADLEGEGYAVAAADLPACSVGAPHRRQRLFWVADDNEARRSEQRIAQLLNGERTAQRNDVDGRGADGNLADTASAGHERRRSGEESGRDAWAEVERLCNADSLGNSCRPRLEEQRGEQGASRRSPGTDTGKAFERAGPWSDLEWLACSDGKARPTQPGLFPLAYGIPGRVGRLRAYGNAIVPQVAAAFIEAYSECRIRKIAGQFGGQFSA